MEIQIIYYSLVDDKKMGDGNIIPKNQDLILIKRDEDGFMFFETHGDECKRLFWATDDEVKFEKNSLQTWSEEKIRERNSYINGEFL